MNRLARHALVAELVRAMRGAGSWCARTHIQKTLYCFQTLFQPEADLRYGYILYMHGVYSFELDHALAEMEFYGALAREDRAPYGPRYSAPGAQLLRERFGRDVERWLPQLESTARQVSRKNVR